MKKYIFISSLSFTFLNFILFFFMHIKKTSLIIFFIETMIIVISHILTYYILCLKKQNKTLKDYENLKKELFILNNKIQELEQKHFYELKKNKENLLNMSKTPFEVIENQNKTIKELIEFRQKLIKIIEDLRKENALLKNNKK